MMKKFTMALQDVRMDPTKFAKQGICYKGFVCKVVFCIFFVFCIFSIYCIFSPKIVSLRYL